MVGRAETIPVRQLQLFEAYFAEYLSEFPVSMLEGTYLVWVDCSVLNQSSDEIVKTLLEKEKLWVNEGSLYGEAGEGLSPSLNSRLSATAVDRRIKQIEAGLK